VEIAGVKATVLSTNDHKDQSDVFEVFDVHIQWSVCAPLGTSHKSIYWEIDNSLKIEQRATENTDNENLRIARLQVFFASNEVERVNVSLPGYGSSPHRMDRL
jgi:hypothetical protein